MRKFFRTQLSAAKIDDEIIKYMMGKTIDTYEDVQSLGIETLRNLYVAAGLAIRPKTKVTRIEQLKEIIRSWGENPEEILSKDALVRSNQTVETDDQFHSHQLSVLATELKQIIRKRLQKNDPQKQYLLPYNLAGPTGIAVPEETLLLTQPSPFFSRL